MNVQQQKKIHRTLWLWWLVVICFATLLWMTVPCWSDDPRGQSTSVIYQVTYKDKTIKNLTDPPTTNENILMVTRITRTNSSLPSTETISTGNQPMEMYNPGRTQETQLRWNGQAWTPAVIVKSKPKPVPAAAPRPTPPRDVIQTPLEESVVADGGVPPRQRIPRRPANIAEIRDTVQEIMELLSVSDRALHQAQQQVAMAGEDPEAIRDAGESLARARKAQQEVTTNLIQLKMSLGIRQNPPRPRVAQASPASPGAPTYDPNRPITPPPVLNTNIAVNGAFGYGWPGACGWPYFGGNVMIQKQEPNPDFDTGPRVIVREQE
jgi:hypothetical protein